MGGGGRGNLWMNDCGGVLLLLLKERSAVKHRGDLKQNAISVPAYTCNLEPFAK